ncbi:MAG: beta strand repeat-containing protein [Microcystaceae cyanobacterium]
MATIYGSELGQLMAGTLLSDIIFAYGGHDVVNAGDGNDSIDGGWGNDSLNGQNGDDTLIGGTGNDTMNGGDGSDTYIVTGNYNLNFTGYDTYTDTGSFGSDRIRAMGSGDVDVVVVNFRPSNGIEIIDGTGATGKVRILGDWQANVLDFSATQLVGSNLVIDGDGQDDTITGSQGNDTIIGGAGNDLMNGGNGSDTYIITGNEALAWPIYQGYDTYKDTGTTGTDRIVAIGPGNVDIGVADFNATGIEIIDGTGTTGIVRVRSQNLANVMNFSTVQFIGSNIQIDGSRGIDTITGTSGNDTIIGGGDADLMDGGQGSDSYLITGNLDNNDWLSFEDHDTYKDTGTVGTDRIVAIGVGNVDVGLVNFSTATSGIEVIDCSGTTGVVRLMGNWLNNYMDFSATTFIGTNFEIHGDGMRDDGGFDTLIGSRGDDKIFGGGGYDTMDGGLGSDTYYIDGNFASGWNVFSGYDTYRDTGNVGTDRIVVVPMDQIKMQAVLAWANIYTPVVDVNSVDIGIQNFSNSGIEIIDATRVSGTVRLLGNWDPNVMDFSTVQFLGSNFVINGDGANDTITGSQGNDNILGGIGNDRIYGGNGDDTLAGELDQDFLDGNNGSDTYVITGNLSTGWNGFDTFKDTGTYGRDRLLAKGTGNVDISMLSFSTATTGIERIDGTGATGTVQVLGDWQANLLDFSGTTFVGSNIVINGDGQADTLIGSNGNDVIVGGQGGDYITGGLGADTLTGGRDWNHFFFNSVAEIGKGVGTRDTITDFTANVDFIHLENIDANTLIAGNQAFSFIGSAAFSGQAGQLRFASGLVTGDVNADRVADFELALTGVTSLIAYNFVL